MNENTYPPVCRPRILALVGCLSLFALAPTIAGPILARLKESSREWLVQSLIDVGARKIARRNGQE